MRFAAFGQKFEVVSESHWFLYEFFILNQVIAINACRYIYELDSTSLSLKVYTSIHGTSMEISSPRTTLLSYPQPCLKGTWFCACTVIAEMNFTFTFT